MDETMNTANETAISSEPETTEGTANVNETDTQPKVQETNESTPASAPEVAEPAPETQSPFLEIKYMKEMKGLTREEAKDLCEKGMHYSALHDKLDYIAAQQDTTVDALLDGIVQSMEDAKRAELEARFGDDDDVINDLMTLYHNSQKEKYEKVKADRKAADVQEEQSVNQRIATEFTAMKKDFPELTDYASLPAEVRKAAADGMPLAYAYLMHNHTENQKVATAAKQAEEAAKKTPGSMTTDENDSATEAEKRFLAGLWGK
jgi:hypothetical protein